MLRGLQSWMISKMIENCNFWFPKPLKIMLWGGLGGVFGESRGVLGSLGASWARFGRALGASWRVRGRLGGVLGPSWGVLGGFWEGSGGSWKLSGRLFRVSWKIFCNSKKYAKITKNLENQLFFIDFRGSGKVLRLEKSKNSMKRR